MRYIEENPLEEQRKWYPLVVAVIGALALVQTEARMRYFGADLLPMIAGHCESVGDPAVGVDHLIKK